MRKKYLGVVVGLIAGLVGSGWRAMPAVADDCPELRVVFARGSGGERWNDQNYLAWKDAIEPKLAATEIDYEFIDLDYPAVGIGVDALDVTLGAWFGAGDAYEFGASVDAGVSALSKIVNGTCAKTKYVLGGYSQGAMVVSKALSSLNADRVIYAATFGDPKIYLPEGKSSLVFDKNVLHSGVVPAACRGENLSDYRAYVPDCYAYKGLLGSYVPYEPAALTGKVGTWCNKTDIFCSSYVSITSHVHYVADGLYDDAGKLIFSKICDAFEIVNHYTSAHDTAILLDTTGSMNEMITKYKAEALRLAEETLSHGGRVALYDYRDLKQGYTPVQYCDFETCDLATFQQALDKIVAYGGGDADESLLSASFTVMKELDWQWGATKSLVILTDAGYHDPDLDGTVFYDVVELSEQIDPVNFYIVTSQAMASDYAELAAATGGRVAVLGKDEIALTDYIMARFDSLPQVEESSAAVELPLVVVDGVELVDDTESHDDGSADGIVRGGGAPKSTGKVAVKFTTENATSVMVALNDAALGIVDASEGAVEFSGIDLTRENVVTLAPFNDERRGESASVAIDGYGDAGAADETLVPLAPNTGRR